VDQRLRPIPLPRLATEKKEPITRKKKKEEEKEKGRLKTRLFHRSEWQGGNADAGRAFQKTAQARKDVDWETLEGGSIHHAGAKRRCRLRSRLLIFSHRTEEARRDHAKTQREGVITVWGRRKK